MRRIIHASPARLFACWTDPTELRQWWGPHPVRCAGAEVDLRVGGRYRIANEFPDGKVLWISGEFEQIEPPQMLVYTWRVEPGAGTIERVTVRFTALANATEVSVMHERITDRTTRERHEQGWNGCLERLRQHIEET